MYQRNKKIMTAKELQNIKLETEMAIESLLKSFNKVCVSNDFQLEEVRITSNETDINRSFNVDLLIL